MNSHTENAQLVKRLFDACMSKDENTIRQLVHKDYTLKDPMMTANGIDELIAMIQSCPSDGKIQDLEIIAEGDKVISIFEGVNNQPSPWKMRMCSIITVENGKVRSEEMIYDTSQIPPDVLKEMKNSALKNRAVNF